MFDTILIANRGEIACRIIKTARNLGMHSIAIYSTADKDSLHVKMADTAYCVGDAPAKDSYLNIDAIIKIAKESKAQAIHPGYGFLSENPSFAKACADAHIVFIGPSITAMEAMASKQLAKHSLENTAVPLTPGYHGTNQSENHLLKEAKKIGFPVLIKAAFGGGGKGMRAVHKESEFNEALAGAKREALAYFADDTLIIEKLVMNPRHVEVQIMADSYGEVVHLFERDCSIQRRHQKIIEEAPAPNLSKELRIKLAQAACEVARSIQYLGAGTIEFLVDAAENFYFMEMNTRLQVEHPVTEQITGLDLVAWQFSIAAGERLPLTQQEISQRGHAIECRIYAEDPNQQFMPSIGQIHFLKQPHFEGIRIDTGVTLFSNISMYYDPMIAKLIAWGATRQEALQRMQQALKHYFIGGVKTNISFLQAICQHPQFINAQLSTHFLDQETLNLPQADKELALFMVLGFEYLYTIKTITDPLFQDTISWQLQGKNSWISSYQLDNEKLDVLIQPISNNQLEVNLRGKKHLLRVEISQDTKLSITIDASHCTGWVEVHKDQLFVYTEPGVTVIRKFNWNSIHSNKSQKGQLTAPMPSTVVAILKQVGEQVKAGDSLIILEAMKMEHTIHAPADGKLSAIFYSVGSHVSEGAELLSLNESE